MSNAKITVRDAGPNSPPTLASNFAAMVCEVEPLLNVVTQLTASIEPLARILAPILQAVAPLQGTCDAAERLLEPRWVANTRFDLVAECGNHRARR